MMHSPFLDVFALGSDIGCPRLRLEDSHGIRSVFGIFHFHDGIGALWNRRAGHDADGLPRSHGMHRHLSCLHVLDHRQSHRLGDRMFLLDVLPPDGESVHRRIVPGRIVSLCDDILAQYPPERIQE